MSELLGKLSEATASGASGAASTSTLDSMLRQQLSSIVPSAPGDALTSRGLPPGEFGGTEARSASQFASMPPSSELTAKDFGGQNFTNENPGNRHNSTDLSGSAERGIGSQSEAATGADKQNALDLTHSEQANGAGASANFDPAKAGERVFEPLTATQTNAGGGGTQLSNLDNLGVLGQTRMDAPNPSLQGLDSNFNATGALFNQNSPPLSFDPAGQPGNGLTYGNQLQPEVLAGMAISDKPNGAISESRLPGDATATLANESRSGQTSADVAVSSSLDSKNTLDVRPGDNSAVAQVDKVGSDLRTGAPESVTPTTSITSGLSETKDAAMSHSGAGDLTGATNAEVKSINTTDSQPVNNGNASTSYAVNDNSSPNGNGSALGANYSGNDAPLSSAYSGNTNLAFAAETLSPTGSGNVPSANSVADLGAPGMAPVTAAAAYTSDAPSAPIAASAAVNYATVSDITQAVYAGGGATSLMSDGPASAGNSSYQNVSYMVESAAPAVSSASSSSAVIEAPYSGSAASSGGDIIASVGSSSGSAIIIDAPATVYATNSGAAYANEGNVVNAINQGGDAAISTSWSNATVASASESGPLNYSAAQSNSDATQGAVYSSNPGGSYAGDVVSANPGNPNLSYAADVPAYSGSSNPSSAADVPAYAGSSNASYASDVPSAYSSNSNTSYASDVPSAYSSNSNTSYASDVPSAYSSNSNTSYASDVPSAYSSNSNTSYASDVPSAYSSNSNTSYASDVPSAYSGNSNTSYASDVPSAYSSDSNTSYASDVPSAYSGTSNASYASDVPSAYSSNSNASYAGDANVAASYSNGSNAPYTSEQPAPAYTNNTAPYLADANVSVSASDSSGSYGSGSTEPSVVLDRPTQFSSDSCSASAKSDAAYAGDVIASSGQSGQAGWQNEPAVSHAGESHAYAASTFDGASYAREQHNLAHQSSAAESASATQLSFSPPTKAHTSSTTQSTFGSVLAGAFANAGTNKSGGGSGGGGKEQAKQAETPDSSKSGPTKHVDFQASIKNAVGSESDKKRRDALKAMLEALGPAPSDA